MSIRQATVRDAGSALLADGTLVPLPAGTLDPRLRVLHPGQRVDLHERDGEVVLVTLPGMGLAAVHLHGAP